ncbi:hypothetical protein BD413DRAFT_213662 [Trametes elegans]|nr:hypothetical protein BD413DRAFT_213662 [Trametes elegans]
MSQRWFSAAAGTSHHRAPLLCSAPTAAARSEHVCTTKTTVDPREKASDARRTIGKYVMRECMYDSLSTAKQASVVSKVRTGKRATATARTERGRDEGRSVGWVCPVGAGSWSRRGAEGEWGTGIKEEEPEKSVAQRDREVREYRRRRAVE